MVKEVNNMEMYDGDFDDDFLEELAEVEDQSKESTFEKELPEAGLCHLRFVGYVELGKHYGSFKGVQKKNPDREVKLTFEIVSPRHTKGKEYPVTLSLNTLSISTNAKAKYHKLFKAMAMGDESIKHLAQCLGKAYCGKIFHTTYKNKKGEEVTFATLQNPDTKEFAIFPPVAEDYETGETRKVNVAPAKSEIVCFVWNKPLLKMWNAIHIEGTTDDGRSKNWMQERCLEAVDFKGSPLQTMLTMNNMPTEVEKPEDNAPAPEAEDAPAPEADEAPKAKRAAKAEKKADKAKETDDNDDIAAMAAEAGLLDD